MKKTVLIASLLAAVALSACGKKEDNDGGGNRAYEARVRAGHQSPPSAMP